MAQVIERVTGIRPCGIGEGPHWDVKDQVLYMVDLNNGSIIRYSPKTSKAIYQELGSHASFIIPVKGTKDEFVVGSELQVFQIKWDFGNNQIVKKEVLVTLTDEVEGAKLNDAKCDVKGRLWFGTIGKEMALQQGAMYSFSKSSGLKKHVTGVCISNGLGFSLDNKKLYYIDTMKKTVCQYAVDVDKNTCEYEKVVINLEEAGVKGLPDGMTVDAEGYLWVGCFYGSEVIRVEPNTGKIVDRVNLQKSRQITSCTFAGPQLDELYVVSADIGDKDLGVLAKWFSGGAGPEAGATYRVTNLGAKGLPPFEFNAEL